jgi:DNA replication protein DnaC
MPYALSGQSLADALNQVQKLAKQFGLPFSGAFVVGKSAAWARLAKAAADNKAIASLFIAAPES